MQQLIEQLTTHPGFLIVFIVVAVILAAKSLFQLLALLAGKSKGSAEVPGFPYRRREALLSPAERSFLGALQLALGMRFQIFSKVRIADLIEPREGLSRSQWQSAFNRIACKHADFVLCDPATLEIVAVVELDDSSHHKSNRKDRDEWLNSALAAASLPIVRVAATRSYATEDLRRKFEAALPPV